MSTVDDRVDGYDDHDDDEGVGDTHVNSFLERWDEVYVIYKTFYIREVLGVSGNLNYQKEVWSNVFLSCDNGIFQNVYSSCVFRLLFRLCLSHYLNTISIFCISENSTTVTSGHISSIKSITRTLSEVILKLSYVDET